MVPACGSEDTEIFAIGIVTAGGGCHDQKPRHPDGKTEQKQTISEGVLQEAGNRPVEQLAQEENELLVKLGQLRAEARLSEAEKYAV